VAGTQWDRLGQKDAVFEIVAPSIRKVAADAGVKLHEFFRDDPIWRLNWAREGGGEAVVDVEWTDEAPDTYWISANWWIDDYDSTMRRSHLEEIGEFTRDQPLEVLEKLLRDAVARVDSWTEQQLDQQSGPHPDWQKYSTREDFYRTRLPRR
jgi:hypothetical protein